MPYAFARRNGEWRIRIKYLVVSFGCGLLLMAPWLGSFWYMTRHITPVAKSETASGAKTTILNATAQRTRSVSTAKRSPSAVTAAGTTSTQIALFFTAVSRMWSVKMFL